MAPSSAPDAVRSASPVRATDPPACGLGSAPQDLPRPLGRYMLLRRIAKGGMGEVFLASTTGLEGAERPVVVKNIRREHASDPSFIARFLDEARVQAQLTSPGVAQVLDAAIDPRTGEPYCVVEHVEGKSLGDVRARAAQVGHRIGWAEAVAIATQIAEALVHVHERHDAAGRPLAIVHRDLSPQNVMVSYAGDAKIIDFGTARGKNRRCRTVAGVVFAKPGYVAPEVAGGDPGDFRVDLYALGIMLWELCENRRFLEGEAADHLARVAKNANNPPPIASRVGAPAELDSIIAMLTACDRESRYPSSRRAARDLARVLASAPPLPGGERSVRARAAHLMQAVFPQEPARSRHEFARLLAAARTERVLATPAAVAATAPGREGADDDVLDGTRYRLLREIGRGTSGVVHEAEHLDIGRRVALKILSADRGAGEDGERFRREAEVLAGLSHDGLVKLYDFGVTPDGRSYAVMELLEGETLERYLARERGMDYREALSMCARCLEALEVAHDAGLVHRDVKPANLFVTLSGGMKVLDFGLAQRTAGAPVPWSEIDARMGRSDGMSLFGTPEYMAPEQANGAEVDARADLYAMGSVLYEMLTGRIPFAEGSPVAILDAKRSGSPERPRDRAPARGIPRAVDELVMRAIARHPSVRFQSASEMRAAVLAALSAPSRSRSNRRALGFATLAAAMAFAGVLLAGTVPEVRALLPPAVLAQAERVAPAAAVPRAPVVDVSAAQGVPALAPEAALDANVVAAGVLAEGAFGPPAPPAHGGDPVEPDSLPEGAFGPPEPHALGQTVVEPPPEPAASAAIEEEPSIDDVPLERAAAGLDVERPKGGAVARRRNGAGHNRKVAKPMAPRAPDDEPDLADSEAHPKTRDDAGKELVKATKKAKGKKSEPAADKRVGPDGRRKVKVRRAQKRDEAK